MNEAAPTTSPIRSDAVTPSEFRGPPIRPVPRKGLSVRFVTRMSPDLSEAVAALARRDGLTAGAWVRRLLLNRTGLESAEDARSGRPIRRPEADHADIAAAIRSLASVSAALAAGDEAAARQGLQQARALLIPIVVRRTP